MAEEDLKMHSLDSCLLIEVYCKLMKESGRLGLTLGLMKSLNGQTLGLNLQSRIFSRESNLNAWIIQKSTKCM